MIDKAKQYKTRDGREVRIYATDHAGDYPVVGAVNSADGWEWENWTASGAFYRAGGGGADNIPEDLIEVTPEQTHWIVAHMALGYDTQAEAQRIARSVYDGCAVAVVAVTFREGDGL